ncbi:MAG: OmpA family protein [Enterovibrio sp.]
MSAFSVASVATLTEAGCALSNGSLPIAASSEASAVDFEVAGSSPRDIGYNSNTPVLAAASPQFFIGAKGGYQWAADDSYALSMPNSSLWGIYGGLQLSPAWSWDIGYQYHDDLKAGATSVKLKTWLIESALRYDWYLQDKLSLYGRLGAAYWDLEKTQLSSYKRGATGVSSLSEVGINYRVAQNARASMGYQYIDRIGKSNTGRYDSHGLLASLTYAFGATAQPASVATNENAPNAEESSNSTKKSASNQSQQTKTFSTKNIEGGFAFDSTKLSAELIQALSEVALALNAHPQAQALIVAHTDSVGSKSYNQALSERRAQSVVNQLIKFGVDPERLKWRGEGESQPIADNTTAQGRAKNRRVEVAIPSFQFKE